jgi:hypothetical protein
MSDKVRPVQSGTGYRPEKQRLRAGTTGLLLTSKNLAQAADGAGVGERWPNFSKKAKRR